MCSIRSSGQRNSTISTRKYFFRASDQGAQWAIPLGPTRDPCLLCAIDGLEWLPELRVSQLARHDLVASLAKELDSCREEWLRFTQDLIRIPTENPPGLRYSECAEAMRAELRRLGLSVEVIQAPEGRVVVRASHGEQDPTQYLHGHYDVVPAQSREQFEPVAKKESLFGRGSADMKGGLAAMIYAVWALARCEVPLRGRLVLSLVPDEETRGRYGSKYLSDSGLLGAGGIGMLTAEPTGGAIWNACRGALSFRVRLKGRPMHVGLHYRGENAFERSLPVVSAFYALKERPVANDGLSDPTRGCASLDPDDGGRDSRWGQLQRRTGGVQLYGRPTLQPGGEPG
jgi:acetylornithine deacetylase/succinyl-diaminopimelate desuccinylase-like protein